MYILLESFIVTGLVLLVGGGLFIATSLVVLAATLVLRIGDEVGTVAASSRLWLYARWRRYVAVWTDQLGPKILVCKAKFGQGGPLLTAGPSRKRSRNEESMMKVTTDEYYREVVTRAEEAAQLAEMDQRAEHLRAFNFGRTVQRIQNSSYDRWRRLGWLMVGLAIGMACGRLYPDWHSSVTHKLASQSSQIVRVAEKR